MQQSCQLFSLGNLNTESPSKDVSPEKKQVCKIRTALVKCNYSDVYMSYISNGSRRYSPSPSAACNYWEGGRGFTRHTWPKYPAYDDIAKKKS
jgi:hypothetical protein